MSSEEVIEEVRNSIGEYCYTECKAFCCRKGYIVLQNDKDVDAVSKGRRKELEDEEILVKGKYGKYYLNIGKKGCPNLTKDFKCSIYADRPSVCRQFPLMNSGKNIIIPSTCPLITEQKLYPLLRKLKEAGYTII